MRWQRNTFHLKEQDKKPEQQLREVEIGNVSEKEFSVMIVKMIQDLRNRVEALIDKIQKCLTMIYEK